VYQQNGDCTSKPICLLLPYLPAVQRTNTIWNTQIFGGMASLYYLRKFICNLLSNKGIRNFQSSFYYLHPSLLLHFNSSTEVFPLETLPYLSHFWLWEINFKIYCNFSATKASVHGLSSLGAKVSIQPFSQYFSVSLPPLHAVHYCIQKI
jgi:hypothetical protein